MTKRETRTKNITKFISFVNILVTILVTAKKMSFVFLTSFKFVVL